jgi:hypothetical protein
MVIDTTCRRCRGEGEVSCSLCRGSGQTGGPWKWRGCPQCGGQRKFECPQCYGMGWDPKYADMESDEPPPRSPLQVASTPVVGPTPPLPQAPRQRVPYHREPAAISDAEAVAPRLPLPHGIPAKSGASPKGPYVFSPETEKRLKYQENAERNHQLAAMDDRLVEKMDAERLERARELRDRRQRMMLWIGLVLFFAVVLVWAIL